MKRKWDISSKELRKKCNDEVLARIEEQDGANFGVLATDEIIDIVLQNLAPDIYNLGIKDAKKLIQDRLADIDVELDLLKNTN